MFMKISHEFTHLLKGKSIGIKREGLPQIHT